MSRGPDPTLMPPVTREAHERLVREAVVAEREACAKIADDYDAAVGTRHAREIAERIRERA